MPRYLHTVQVKNTEGRAFPIDMLRYDGLVPATEQDAAEIQASIVNEATGEKFMSRGRFIDLKREADSNWHPGNERWRSFKFEVENHDKRRI